jgi:LacI family transcriptional regulator
MITFTGGTKMKKAKVTIYEVAGKANVSLATVSRVLNYPEKVKASTRERVMGVINELGYRPNAIARGLASRKSTFIGIVVPDFSRASVAEAVNGIALLANQYGYQILVFPAEGEDRSSKDVWADVVASQVDGVLYLNDLVTDKDIEYMKTMSVPIVIANVLLSKENSIPTVNIDYERAAYEITKKLISRGRKQIMLAQTRREYSMNNAKEIGYLRALKEANISPIILRTSGKPHVNYPVVTDFLRKTTVDAIIGVRDSIAVACLNVVIDLGFSVPADVEVYGFQNTRTALLARPQLSTIDVPTFEIGKQSMEMLSILMNEEPLDQYAVVVPYGIVERGSTKQ